MITFFTTFRHFNLPEQNAVNSWLKMSNDTEVIIFSENAELKLKFTERVTFISEFKKHSSGLPLLNDLFQQASERSRHNTLCYCNSDIILMPGFIQNVGRLLGDERPFLGASQRTDVDLSFLIDFENPDSVSCLNEAISGSGSIHPPLGSDIFLFPKYQYDEGTMPPLVVGRPGWDLWMLFDARQRFNRLIDLTAANPLVIHQNHPQKYYIDNPQHRMNFIFLPPKNLYTFVLSFCNYRVADGELKKIKLRNATPSRLRWELKFNQQPIVRMFLFFIWIKAHIRARLRKVRPKNQK